VFGTVTKIQGAVMSDEARVQRALPLKPSHFHILLSLVDGPVHAYGVRHEVEARTNGRIVLPAGTLYETFQRMERDGWVEESEPPEELEQQASSRWRFFQATPLGRCILEAEVGRLEADLAAAREKVAPA
jgi:DNA-binding PadR family transcriptional regulator